MTRSAVAEVPAKGRDTMGVKFVSVRGEDAVSVIALNPEANEELDETEPSNVEDGAEAGTVDQSDAVTEADDEETTGE